MNTIKVNNYNLPIREFRGQRVVTLRDIDQVHSRPEGTARKRLNDNKKHFIEGTDYFVRNPHEAAKEYDIIAPSGLNLLTESGYLMLVKSFGDNLAWEVQRQLVNGYFKAKQDSTAYPPKCSSIGEVASLTNTQDRVMQAQKSPGWKRANAFAHMVGQFGISVIDNFVEPPTWESQQLALAAAPTFVIGHADITVGAPEHRVVEARGE